MTRVFTGLSRFFTPVFLTVAFMLSDTVQLCGQATDTAAGVWMADGGDGTYRNPILYADYSDPDVVRVGADFFMVSSSFNCVPGIPVLHSKDMVNWQIINHVFKKQIPDSVFSIVQHGNGAWAPSIRHHKGEFYVYYGDPDFGIYMSKTSDPLGSWSEPHLLRPAKGWIDPCPLWDDDGNAYLVHAFAGSRSGRKSILVAHRMTQDGKTLLDDGVMVFDGHASHPTIEGPKFYKRNGFYYIFAPGGGVQYGWQTVLRSSQIYGPYEDRVVLHEGKTGINGPHQGAWIELENGTSWFYHFQDCNAYGRILHLQPMEWKKDWPVIGSDPDGDGIGEPVKVHRKPNTGYSGPLLQMQTSDEFNSPLPGLQWQWQANPEPEWMFLAGNEGFMRLYCQYNGSADPNFWEIPHLYLQKFPAPEFTATAKVRFQPMQDGDRMGLIIMGMSYSAISIEQSEGQIFYTVIRNPEADQGGENLRDPPVPIQSKELYMRVQVMKNAKCAFSISTDGKNFTGTGDTFEAVAGKWIGAKVGLFAVGSLWTNDTGWADVDWFRITK
ncbi:MAG: glycoside hydrolase 43 family protein [Bacteroidales bacterium]